MRGTVKPLGVTGAALLALVSFNSLADSTASPAPFLFSPQPRWAEEPETEILCAAIQKECPRALRDGQVEANMAYDELYDAKGMLVGVRMTRSTGCKPLDENSLLSKRRFRLTFRQEGQPDLDDVRLEVAPDVDPAKVRIVKSSETSLSIGCF